MSIGILLRVVAGLLLLWAAAALAQTFHPPGCGADLPPEARALLPKLVSGKTLTPVFWQRTVDFRDGETSAWLIGAGRSDAAITVAVVNAKGDVIARAPATDAGYDGGFVVRVAPGQFVLVLTSPAGRRLSSTVLVMPLGDSAGSIFSYTAPANGALWNSVLYFTDLDDDGQLELLIDRSVYLEGQRTQERVAYRFDLERRAFRETVVPGGWLAKVAEAARANPAVPRAVQYSVSYPADALR